MRASAHLPQVVDLAAIHLVATVVANQDPEVAAILAGVLDPRLGVGTVQKVDKGTRRYWEVGVPEGAQSLEEATAAEAVPEDVPSSILGDPHACSHRTCTVL